MNLCMAKSTNMNVMIIIIVIIAVIITVVISTFINVIVVIIINAVVIITISIIIFVDLAMQKFICLISLPKRDLFPSFLLAHAVLYAAVRTTCIYYPFSVYSFIRCDHV